MTADGKTPFKLFKVHRAVKTFQIVYNVGVTSENCWSIESQLFMFSFLKEILFIFVGGQLLFIFVVIYQCLALPCNSLFLFLLTNWKFLAHFFLQQLISFHQHDLNWKNWKLFYMKSKWKVWRVKLHEDLFGTVHDLPTTKRFDSSVVISFVHQNTLFPETCPQKRSIQKPNVNRKHVFTTFWI